MKLKLATVIVPLEPEKEKIFSSFNKSARRGINKGKKLDLEIVEDSKLEEFYQRYLKFMQQMKLTPPSLESLKENIIKIIEVKYKGEFIGGMGVDKKGIDNSPSTEYIYTTPKSKTMDVNGLLFWNCILWAKSQGYQKIDLAGYALDPQENQKGINEFKKKFGKVVEFKKEVSPYKYIKCKLVGSCVILYGLNKFLRRVRNKIKKVYKDELD